MKKTETRGRKRSGKIQRTAKVPVCMTPEDAQWFTEFAEDCGFSSRSQLLSAILERLKLGGFSPAAAARLASQIQARIPKDSNRPQSIDWDSMLLRPLPPLPEDAPFDRKSERQDLKTLNERKPPG